MKILLINKYYYVKGGSETYFFGLKEMLETNGHEVIVFSMHDDKNFETKYNNYFVSNVNYNESSRLDKVKNAINLIYSKEAYIKLCKLIEDTKPDIAHVNLIYHQLTPSIFHALKKYKVPVVFTSHDYKMICPNYKLLSHDRLCEKCLDGKYYNCVINKCHKNSYAYSTIVAVEAYVHRFLKSYDIPYKIICPSEFMKQKLIQSGVAKEKLVHLPNFIDGKTFTLRDNISFNKKDKSILYYGRLSQEKGIDLLLDAKKFLPDDIILNIVGTGPLEKQLKDKVRVENIKNVNFLGFMNGQKLYEQIGESICTVIPSRWYEVFGLTIAESYCLGTPVVGARIGGITEIIEEGITGGLFEPNNSSNLAEKLNVVLNMAEDDYKHMVEDCIEKSNLYSPVKYYSGLMKVYEEALEIHGLYKK